MTAPSDAHLEERGDQFVIIPEEKGTTLKNRSDKPGYSAGASHGKNTD